MNEIPSSETRARIEAYYTAVAPFYEAETAIRRDIPGWIALVRRVGPRRVLDLGCGGGRLAPALAGTEAVGVDLHTALARGQPPFAFVGGDLRALPFATGSFDLAVAANDPYAHLLGDDERRQSIAEALRVARRVVIDGLALPPPDRTRAREGELERRSILPGGVVREERWRWRGDDAYRVTYRYLRGATMLAEATTDVRAWRVDEPALAAFDVTLSGTLAGGVYDPDGAGFVIEVR
ncbi:MAG: class I SAM-dependent methyltransferase [Chloroflexota bacterium]|nr:class I SAM-dependent methyltransferase [Chloroflexota bacterium]